MIHYDESGTTKSSTTEMCDMPFALNSICNLDFERVSFVKMQTFWRLALSPLLPIAFTMLEKHRGSRFQSVVISSWPVLPENWKLRNLMLNLRSFPKSRAGEQWIHQKWNIIHCVFFAALKTVCRSFALKSMQLKATSLVVLAAAFKNEFE